MFSSREFMRHQIGTTRKKTAISRPPNEAGGFMAKILGLYPKHQRQNLNEANESSDPDGRPIAPLFIIGCVLLMRAIFQSLWVRKFNGQTRILSIILFALRN